MSKTESLRDAILATDDLKFEAVEVPEWNFSGFIRELNGESRWQLSQIAEEASGSKNVHIVEAYVCEGLFDQDKKRVFTIEDRHQLANKNPIPILRLYRKILAISKMDQESVDSIEKKSDRATG